MPEHLIRLRGGWEWADLDDRESRPTRITLPAHLHLSESRRLRLTRRFGRPPMDILTETLWLRLERVPGLKSIAINGAPVPLERLGASPLEVALRELADRNLVELDVNLPASETAGHAIEPRWGEIALVVRTVAR